MKNNFYVIFTDLDGTLLDEHTYQCSDVARQVISELVQKRVPLIPVSSKTRAEVEVLRAELGLADSFIVENGSGIFIPGDDPWLTSRRNTCVTFGGDYTVVRQKLALIAMQTNTELRGFGDMTVDEIRMRTGLGQDAQLSAQRQFSEPFLIPSGANIPAIVQAARLEGMVVLKGDRFFHLLPVEVNKGRALTYITGLYREVIKDRPVVAVALGNSHNDLDMLKAAQIAIAIPSDQQSHLPLLQLAHVHIATQPGSEGWAQSVREILF